MIAGLRPFCSQPLPGSKVKATICVHSSLHLNWFDKKFGKIVSNEGKNKIEQN